MSAVTVQVSGGANADHHHRVRNWREMGMVWGWDGEFNRQYMYSLITLIGSEAAAGKLPRNLLLASVAVAIQVKLVSVVVRGERVRVEEEEEGPVLEMRMRPPDTKSEPLLSCQLKEYSMSPTSTTVLSTLALQVTMTSSIPPTIMGPWDTVRVTTGGETAGGNNHTA